MRALHTQPGRAWLTRALVLGAVIGLVAVAAIDLSGPSNSCSAGQSRHGSASRCTREQVGRGARPYRTELTAHLRRCISKPGACGYPDQTNAGVPIGTSLTPSGSITLTTPGTVVTGLDVTGTITVAADNVTIKNTRVTNSWTSGYGIYIKPKVSGTLIEDSTVRGGDSRSGSLGDGILNAGSNSSGLRLYVYNCAGTNWNGPGTVTDSFMTTNAYVAGAHTEPLYWGGGADRSLTVEHDTLLNPFKQTAVVVGGTDYGPQTNLTVDHTLLAGGGWMVYGGSTSPATANVRITNNRFSTVYFPHGGYFGLSAYIKGSVTTWSGNYWDASLQPASG